MLNDRWGACPTSAVCPIAIPEFTVPVEAVFFDLCGVLYDDTIWRRWLLQLLSHMGLHTHYTSFFHVWDREYQDAVSWGEMDYWQALRRFLLSAGLTSCQSDEIEAAGRPRFRSFADSIRPFPGVRNAVTRLAASGLKLGIACRLPLSPEELAKQLDQLRLSEHFRSRYSMRDLGRQATTQDFFHALLDGTNVAADRIIYVGRDARALETAHRMGLHTIGFNLGPQAAADVVLEQYHHLPELLDHGPQSLLAAS